MIRRVLALLQLAMVQMQDLLALDEQSNESPRHRSRQRGMELQQEAHEFGVTDRTKSLIWMCGRQKR